MLFDPKKPTKSYIFKNNQFTIDNEKLKNNKYRLLIFESNNNGTIFFHFPGLDQQNGAFVKKARFKGEKEEYIYQRLLDNNYTVATVPYPQFMKNDSDHEKYFDYVNKAVQFIRKKYKAEKIIFGAHSFGGNVFLYAVENKRIKMDKNDLAIILNAPIKPWHLVKRRYLYPGYRHMTAIRIKIQTTIDRSIPTQSLRGYLKRSIWLKNYIINDIKNLPKNIYLFAHPKDRYVQYTREELNYKNVYTWDEANVGLDVDLPSCHNASYYFPEFINAVNKF